MPVPFIMPKVDMDQESARIINWHKNEGEHVEMDEIVLTVETDKVAIDIPAPAGGILARISAHVGDEVPVTQVIAYIFKEGEALSLTELKTNSSLHNQVLIEPANDESVKTASKDISVTTQGKPSISSSRPIHATPVAARMAKELGVDLSQIPASNKQVTREDVERYIASRDAVLGRVTEAATPAARRLGHEMEVDLNALTGTGPHGRIQVQDVVNATKAQSFTKMSLTNTIKDDIQIAKQDPQRPAEIVPLKGIRQTIAERMQTSVHEAPHIALTIEVNMSRLETARSNLNEIASHRGESKVTLTTLLVWVCAWALERHPYLNASLIKGQIYLWKDINIGVATALPEGLIVPVIHEANHKTVGEIAHEFQSLNSKAMDGKLSLSDVQHGTFTISNLGMFNIQQFSAIINPPEVAILAVGKIIRKPVVINELDEVAIRPIMTLTLSVDHRVVDGAMAARFLGDIVQALEIPELLVY